MLLPLLLLGCSSSGSRPPAGPESELSIGYCRVELSAFEMHAQWATDHAARGEMQFGLVGYSDTVRVSAYADTQDVALPGLEWSASYLYRIVLARQRGAQRRMQRHVYNARQGFARADDRRRFRWRISPQSTARLSWRTDEPATTVLHYGDGTTADSVVDDALSIEHRVTLRALEPLRAVYAARRGRGQQRAARASARIRPNDCARG